MRIFLVRHGQSIANTGQNAELGFADHRVVLTENGKEQARQSALALQQYIADHKIDLSKSRAWNRHIIYFYAWYNFKSICDAIHS